MTALGTMQVSMRALKSKVVQVHIDEHHQAADQGYVAAEEFLFTAHPCRRKDDGPASAAGIEHPNAFVHEVDDPGHKVSQGIGKGNWPLCPWDIYCLK